MSGEGANVKNGSGSHTETSFTDLGAASSSGNGHAADSPLRDAYDPAFKGPVQNRSCTDVLCCLIFIIFIAGLGVVAAFAFLWGDPELLIYPQDSNGNLCGVGEFKGKEKLFFFDLVVCGRLGPGVFVNGCPTPQVCVAECPKKNFVYLQALATDDRSELICKDGFDPQKSSKSIQKMIEDDDCAAYYLESESVINRCLPLSNLLDFSKNVLEVVTDNGTMPVSEGNNSTVSGPEMSTALTIYETFLRAKEYGEKVVADVVASWWMILIGLFISMLLSMIWIVCMRWFAGFMVWLTVLAFVIIWLGLTVFCFYHYKDVEGTTEEFSIYIVWRFTFLQENVFLAGGIIFGVIFLITFLILLFLCERIRIAIALIKQGSRAVSSMWSTLFWPIFPFILQVGVIGLWACIAVYLASVGRSVDEGANNITTANGSLDEDKIRDQIKSLFDEVPCKANESEMCGFIKYGEGDYTLYLQIYNLFMLFWLVNFVAAVGELTLAGAFSSWYWTFNKKDDLPMFPLSGAFYRCFRYHLGSLAFGSLILAIVKLIRTFLEYLDAKLKGTENKVAQFFVKCLKCCFWCLEKFIKFLNKNAYIMMGVYGKNFCSSAKRAFELILRNVVRVFVLDKVTDFLLFICKLVVVGATGVAAYFFFDGRITFLSDYKPTLNFYFVPITIVVLGSYIIACIFFSVYEMAVDTLFLCFLDDIERNDGSKEKPYFMGKDLMKILGKKNFKPKGED